MKDLKDRNQYKMKIRAIESDNNNPLRILLDASFQGIKRLFFFLLLIILLVAIKELKLKKTVIKSIFCLE